MRAPRLAALVVALVLLAACSAKKKSTDSDTSDTTKRERSSILAKASRRITGGLTSPLTLKLYATQGSKEVDAFVSTVRPLLDAYVEASRRDDGRGEPWITVEVVNAYTADGARAAKEAGLSENVLVDGSAVKGFSGFAFEVGKTKDHIAFWPPNDTQGLEFFLTTKIRELRATEEGTKIRIGIITGKKELALTDETLGPPSAGKVYTLLGVFEQYLPIYEFIAVDLEGGAAGVDPRVSGLIVTQPAVDYTDAELRQIDAFLMRGGKALTVMASAVNLAPYEPSLRATLSAHGLEKLLAGYGVEMAIDAVFDPAAAMGLELAVGSARLPVPWALIIGQPGTAGAVSTLDTNFPPFFRLDEVAFPFASTLLLHPERQPDATLKARARTSPRAVAVTDATIDMSLTKMLTGSAPSGEGAAERIVAASVEGKIASAFDDGRTSPDSRVLVLSSSQFLANPFARAGNPPPIPPQMRMMGGNTGDRDLQMVARYYYKETFPWLVMSFKNTLDWMADDPDMAELIAKVAPATSGAPTTGPAWTDLLK